MSVKNSWIGCICRGKSHSAVSFWNKLFVNVDKSKVPKFTLKIFTEVNQAMLGDGEIYWVLGTNFIGINIDSKLNYEQTVAVSRRLSSLLFLLRRLSFLCSHYYLLTAYYGCVPPILTYGVPISGHESSKTKLIYLFKKGSKNYVLSAEIIVLTRYISGERFSYVSMYQCLSFLRANLKLFHSSIDSNYDLRNSIP